MRKIFSLFSILLSQLITSCGGDDLDILDQSLQGNIDGESWTYGSANAFLVSANGQYQARFLSKNESVSDPCTLPSPGLTHVRAIFTPAIRDYTISPQVIDPNQVQVAFEVTPSKVIIVTNGFMNIFDINNSFAVGYLQAELDNGNKVEGSFEIRFCN
ncbi:MAG: hypothetical protein AAF600_14030 [Bacteroidota bacterium]